MVRWETIFKKPTSENKQKALRKLTEYEDTKERGTVYVLPFGLGDTIYSIHEKNMIVEYTVSIIRLSKEMTIIECTSGMLCNMDDFGKFIFLSREDAEEKRKKTLS